MSLIKKAPKYTLLDSGYLDRLIYAFGLVKYHLNQGQITLVPDWNNEDDEEEFDIEEEDPPPIFIWTSYEKKYIYCPNDLDIAKYQADILKVFAIERPEGSLCGLIMFENEADATYDKVKLLDRQNYCGCFGVMGMNTYFDGDQFFAVEYEIEGESG
jgi:hypothetical protein